MRFKLFFIVFFCSLTSMMTAKTEKLKLHIIETTDVHGCFFPYNFITRQPMPGSLARVSTYVRQLRATGEPVLLLDNGDILQGQPVCYYSNFVDTLHANIAAQVCNYLQYDAQSIGNHDIETGHRVYDAWRVACHFPQLGANIVNAATGQSYYAPYTIIHKKGLCIAMIGMLTPAIPNWLSEDLWSGLKFEDIVKSARYWVQYVEEHEQPDLVVGLFHSGKSGGITTEDYMEDAALKVAQEVPGYDVILFGHDHTKYCGTVRNKQGKEVLLLNPANNARAVGHATLFFEKNAGRWQLQQAVGELRDVSQIEADSAYMNHFAPYIDEVNRYVNRQIGSLDSTIFSRDGFFGNSAFNDLIHELQLQLTHADISFSAPLQFDARLSAGPLYVADMFNLCKYENQLYVMRLTGEEIRKHLEMSYDQWVNTMRSAEDHLLLLNHATKSDQQRLGFKNFTFNFDSAMGIDYEVDVTKPDGQKVRILQMSDGTPFNESKWYHVAVNSYRANGGGELLTLGAGIPKDSLSSRIVWKSEKDLRHYLIQWIEQHPSFAPRAGHNWKFVPEQWTVPAARRDAELLFSEQ